MAAVVCRSRVPPTKLLNVCYNRAQQSNLFNDLDQLLFHFSEIYLTITIQG